MITIGTHVGTHIDALAHVSHDGRCTAGRRGRGRAGGKYDELGVHTIEPMVRAGCSWTSPAHLGARAARGRLRDHRRRTSRRRRRARASHVGAGDVVLVRSGWGQLFAEGAAVRRRARPGCPGVAEAGARWLADHRRARGGRRHDRLRAAGARRRARRCCRPTGCCWSSTASTSSRRSTSRRWPRRGVARVHLRAGAAQHLRRDRLAGPAPGGGVACMSARPSPSSWAPSRPAPSRRAARRGRRQRRACGCSTPSASRVAAAPLETSLAARRWAQRAGRRAAARPPIGVPDRLPAALAAFVNGVLAHSLDYDDTHLPSVLHPSASRGAGGPGRRRAGAAPTGAELVAGGRGRPRGLRPARHGRLRRGGGQLACSSSTASTRPPSAAQWAAPSPRRCCVRAPRRERVVARARRRRLHGGRHHRGQPHRRHRQADPLRLGSPRRRSPPPSLVRPRPHRAADRARGALRLLPGVAARHVRSRRGDRRTRPRLGGPGIFFKPYPANHFTHAVIDAAAALRRRGVTPDVIERAGARRPRRQPAHGRRADRGQARPQTGYMAQFTAPYAVTVGLLGGGGLGAALEDYTDELARTRVRRALMDKPRRRRPTTSARRSSLISSRPWSRVLLPTAPSWRRRC